MTLGLMHILMIIRRELSIAIHRPTVRRFKVGARVEARVSMVPEKWLPATVVDVNYREPHL